MIPIPKYAKNVKLNIIEDENNCIKEIHVNYEVDKNKVKEMFENKIHNTPSMMRTIINQANKAHKLYTKIIKNKTLNKNE